jgi:hypothetical protein
MKSRSELLWHFRFSSFFTEKKVKGFFTRGIYMSILTHNFGEWVWPNDHFLARTLQPGIA